MAYVSVTNTFSNGSTANATDVNTNFSDIIAGLSDGTKAINMAAATFSGNVTLGGSSSHDLSISASLASTVAIKTTFTYDIGSATVGLRYVYLGSNDSAAKSVKLAAGAVGTSYTFTFPTSGGTDGYPMISQGSGTTTFQSAQKSIGAINLGISASVSGNALTIAITNSDGSTNASSTAPIRVGMRSSTATTGGFTERTITAALSMTVPASTTIGTANGITHYIYVYLIDNAGTLEVACSLKKFDCGSVVTTSAVSGGASNTTMYSTTARTSVACKLIGRITITEATAGTWATSPAEVSLIPFNEDTFISQTAGYTRIEYCRIDFESGGSVIEYDPGGVVSSVTRASTGNYSVLLSSSIFRSTGAYCVAGAFSASTGFMRVDPQSPSKFNVELRNTGGSTADGFIYNFILMGQR